MKQLTVIPDHCRFEDVFTVKREIDPTLRATLDSYLDKFAKPTENGECLKCGTVQGEIMGAFIYGLAHGEGYCSVCKWPARANHYFKDAAGKDIGSMRVIMQYHPDFVSEPKESDHARD